MSGGQVSSGRPPVRRGRRVVEVVAILLCFVLIALINAYLRADEPGTRWYVGPPGEPVESPAFDITVTDVVLAERVAQGYTELTSEGVLVVVEWTADVKGARALLAGVELHTASGLTLHPRREFLYSAGPGATDAGFTRHATSVFQVRDGDALGADFVVHFDRGFAYTYAGAVRVRDVVDGATPVVGGVEVEAGRLEVTP